MNRKSLTNELRKYSKQIKADPENGWLYHDRAQVYVHLRQQRNALEDLNRAVLLDKQNPFFYCSRGWASLKFGDWQTPLADFDQAIALDPALAEAHFGRAAALCDLHKYRASLPAFDEAVRLAPKKAFYRYWRGKTRLRLNQGKGALNDFEAAVRLDPSKADFYYERACARLYYTEEGEIDRVYDDLQRAIRKDRESSQAYYERGLIRFCRRYYRRALSDFQHTINVEKLWFHHGNAALWLYLSRLFLKEERLGLRELKAHLKSYRSRPRRCSDEMVEWPYAVIHYYLGEITEEQLFDHVRSRKEDDEQYRNKLVLECHFWLAEPLMAKGDIQKAKTHLKKVCSLPPTWPARWVALRQLGQREEKRLP